MTPQTQFDKGRPVPRRLLFRVLRPYQDEAVDFLIDNPFAGLFIDMGLGKTAIILHAILEFEGPVLLIGPIRVIETVWEKEAREWAATRNLRFSLLRGTPAQRKAAAGVEADIYMVNPELLEEALELRNDYKVLVIDESTLFKNPSSKRFKTLRKHLARFDRRVIATGTPAPNSLMDLWSQVFILDRGERLDRAFSRFKNKYFYQTDWQGFKFEPHDWAKDKIVEAVSDVVYRVPDVGVLPAREVIRNTVTIPLPPKARKVYAQMEKEAFAELKGQKVLTAATAATAMMKLRQIAGGFVYDEEGKVHAIHTEKIQAVESILAETGSPVLLVYQFKHELAALKKAFPQGVEFTSDREADWNEGKLPLVFVHPQNAGHGLNLQFGGHTMIVYSGSFSLEQMSQIMKRIDRPGQKHPVIYHFLVAEDSVDNLLMGVLERRAGDQTQVLQMIKEYADRHAKKNRHR